MPRLRAGIAAAAVLLVLAGCSSTVGGSAVAGSTPATSSAPPTASGTASGTGGGAGDTSSALPTLSISIPQPPDTDAESSGDEAATGRSSGTPSTAPSSPDESGTTTGVTVTTATTVATTSTPTTPTAPTSESPSDPFAGATAVDPDDFPGQVTPVGFSLPSANIGCGFQPTKTPHVTCQIEHHTYPDPAPDCGGAGPTGGALGISLGGSPEFECDGDLESGGPTLGYGKMISVSGLECVSRESGVSCRDAGSGNGFRLATASYVLIENGASTTVTAKSTAPSSLSKFSGEWSGHGRGITFTAPGVGTVTYRSYVWCSDDPKPPCDATKDDQIIPGGKVAIALTSAATKGSTVTGSGSITSSTDPAYPKGTRITAAISGYDLSLSIWPDSPFCAADTPSDKWDCGA